MTNLLVIPAEAGTSRRTGAEPFTPRGPGFRRGDGKGRGPGFRRGDEAGRGGEWLRGIVAGDGGGCGKRGNGENDGGAGHGNLVYFAFQDATV